MEITIAKREKIKIPILVTGASGSGKTASSLIMAKGIIEKMFPKLSEDEQWKKIAVIDTEHERSKYYADAEIAGVHIGEFYHADFEPPYTDSALNDGITDLKNKGVEVIILDSLSHLWSGKGGIQDQVDEIGKRYKGQQMMGWNQIKPNIDNLLRSLTANSIYMISTARSKTGYDMEKNDKGKVVPVKVGLKPEIRDGWEYEFAVVFDINQEHFATAVKDNTNMFDEMNPITKETGYKIFEWSSEGIDPEEERQQLIKQVRKLIDLNDNNKSMVNAWEKKSNTGLNDWSRKQLKFSLSRLSKVKDDGIGQQKEKSKSETSSKPEHQISNDLQEQLRAARERLTS
ncbi:AAA family ATPase [Companilactobacillus zhachilii]|uniref:AAA family ATPase n=1 Tax=Companilactobacillus zhachilii TaxID=2304606 RepID=UPI0040338719